ncbi:hypothetical protein EC988_006246, partial [Linderina pennispora]
KAGGVAAEEMARTFNCGIGMVMVVAKEHVDTVVAELTQSGESAYVIGSVVPVDAQASETERVNVSNTQAW